MTEMIIIHMEFIQYVSVNIPLTAFNLFANLFYVCSLLFPSKGQDVRQPLKVLLGFIVGCNVLFQVVLILYMSTELLSPQGYFQFAVNAVAVLAIEANMISCGCLSAFYFTQIVPPRRSYFIWIKRNIKTIIYLGLLLYYFYFLIEWIVIGLVFYDVFSQSRTDHTNSTSGAGPVQNLSGNVLGLSSSINTMIGCRIFVIWMSLGVMTLSSCTTVRYLRRHMKNMESSSISFSSPQLQSQMRVTIIGIVQGLLYLLCALWFCVDVWLRAIEFIIFDIDRHISLTVYSLYCLGSSVNLGVGQSLFRQRAAGLRQRITKVFIMVACYTKDVK